MVLEVANLGKKELLESYFLGVLDSTPKQYELPKDPFSDLWNSIMDSPPDPDPVIPDMFYEGLDKEKYD